jgi:hypothetical protein
MLYSAVIPPVLMPNAMGAEIPVSPVLVKPTLPFTYVSPCVAFVREVHTTAQFVLGLTIVPAA